MGDCRQILESATIGFPKPIGLEETEKLIYFICKNLPGRANYHAGYHKSVGRDFDRPRFYSERGNIDLAGMIIRGNGSISDGFNCLVSRGQDTSKFEALAFQPIPGYDECEHNPSTLELWDDVRKLVYDYFKNR